MSNLTNILPPDVPTIPTKVYPVTNQTSIGAIAAAQESRICFDVYIVHRGAFVVVDESLGSHLIIFRVVQRNRNGLLTQG